MTAQLVSLPVRTFGDVPALGLELWVWCTRCKLNKRLDIGPELAGRPFAGARFRCQRVLWDGSICGAGGYATIRPPHLLPTDEDIGTADLYCDRCVPPWQALQLDARQPPWKLEAGQAFRCPGCRQRVLMRVRQAAWRPYPSARPGP